MATVTDQSLEPLPAPVARSLRRSGVIGRPIPSTVDLRQVGEILLRDRWFPFTAAESYRVDTPAFEWRGTVGMFGLPLAKARDTLADGRGRMHVRLLGLKTVVDESGPEMDQGSLMRWLNETMWFPHVWATPLISWTSIDGNSAGGSVTAGATTAEAEFVFDDDGRLDMALSGFFQESITFLFGREPTQAGDSLYEDPEVVILPSTVWHIASADFNHDGLPDLVGVGLGGDSGPDNHSVPVLINNGDRTFSVNSNPTPTKSGSPS